MATNYKARPCPLFSTLLATKRDVIAAREAGRKNEDPDMVASGSSFFLSAARLRRRESGLARLAATASSAAMKVSFTQKDYARLLELVHLGLWVAGSRPEDPATMPDRYEEIAQKVFALAEMFGCADLVETDVNGQAYPGGKLTDGPAREKLDRFVEDTFWGELAARLAARDLQAEIGADALEADELAPEHDEKLAELEDAYWREFEHSGVDHLVVIKGGRG